MLCTNLVEHLLSLVIITLVVVVLAPNVLTRSDQIAKNAINQPKQNGSITKQVPFEEYFIEHNVSEGDARRSFLETGIKLIDEKPLRWCMNCAEHVNYCLSGKMLIDHCCCDSRHAQEQIPWIPHSCYELVGKPCLPSTGSCITYTEIRQCCCNRLLAKRWKSIYSNSTTATVNVFIQLVCVFLFISRSLVHKLTH